MQVKKLGKINLGQNRIYVLKVKLITLYLFKSYKKSIFERTDLYKFISQWRKMTSNSNHNLLDP